MLSIGAFSIQVIHLAIAAALAWLASRFLGRKLPDGQARKAGHLIFDTLLVSLLCARLVFVLSWWPDYAQAPRSIVALNDGGFHMAAGLLAAIVWIGWKTQEQVRLRRAVYGGMLAGLLGWGLLNNLPALLQRSAPVLPPLQLSTLEQSEPVALASFQGAPLVINLWATWCPPCRREMPVLQEAQGRYPGVTFVLINQGEGSRQVENFLAAEELTFEHILLDPAASMMNLMGSQGLPTTLYFDANGHLVEAHVGEVTLPGLSSALQRHFGIRSGQRH